MNLMARGTSWEWVVGEHNFLVFGSLHWRIKERPGPSFPWCLSGSECGRTVWREWLTVARAVLCHCRREDNRGLPCHRETPAKVPAPGPPPGPGDGRRLQEHHLTAPGVPEPQHPGTGRHGLGQPHGSDSECCPHGQCIFSGTCRGGARVQRSPAAQATGHGRE